MKLLYVVDAALHGLTTQSLYEMWMAIAHKARRDCYRREKVPAGLVTVPNVSEPGRQRTLELRFERKQDPRVVVLPRNSWNEKPAEIAT